MKIIPINIRNLYSCSNEIIKSDSNSLKSPKAHTCTKNFDEIIIQSRSASVSEDKFFNDVTTNMSKELRTPPSTDKLDELKQQIAEGTYQIGINEIVKKIFLA